MITAPSAGALMKYKITISEQAFRELRRAAGAMGRSQRRPRPGITSKEFNQRLRRTGSGRFDEGITLIKETCERVGEPFLGQLRSFFAFFVLLAKQLKGRRDSQTSLRRAKLST